MDCLHCHNCLNRSISSSVKYYLTECEKVFCNKCLETNIKNCLKCSPNKCRNIELNDRTKSDIQMMFKDITSSFKNLQTVEVFQKTQRNHLIQKLLAENKRLVDECNHQKEINQNLENELKTIRAQMADNRRESNPFNNLFNDCDESQTNGNKSIFKDLFKTMEPKNTIFESKNSQMRTNSVDEPMDQFSTPVSYVPNERYNQRENPLISGPKALSPLQSIRKSKISVRSTNPSMSSRNQTSNLQQMRETNLQLPPMKPMTYTLNKYMSSLSSGSEKSPYIPKKYPQRASPSSQSSIMTLSSLNRSIYNSYKN